MVTKISIPLNLFKLVLCILLFPVWASAQSNYKAGYIVDLKGDTVKGLIDYREWDKNPVEVRFKTKADNTEPEKISPTSVLAFGVTGLEYYESYNLRISRGQTDVAKLSIDVDTSTS